MFNPSAEETETGEPMAHRPASLACWASARLMSGPVSAGQYSVLTASLHRHVHSYTCAHHRGVVAHTYNTTTQEAKAGRFQ